MSRIRHVLSRWSAVFPLLILLAFPAAAQTCYTSGDMDVTTKAALEQTAHQIFAQSARGDYAGLRANSVASLAANFSGVESAVGEHQKEFQTAQATPTGVFLLDAPGSATLQRAEFFCGIYNSPDRVSFVIPNLPPGKFGVVTESIRGSAKPLNLTLVLQQEGAAWKLAGYTVTPTTVGGHDANYFLTQARAFKAKGANMAAYMYYLQAWELSGNVPFEYTAARDKIADEMQTARPADLPSAQAPLTLAGAGKIYRVTQVFPEAVGNDLDLIVKYQAVSDLSNTSAAFQDNTAVIKAVVARYPELRDAFAGVVARAVDTATGRDYGTLLAMKDVK